MMRALRSGIPDTGMEARVGDGFDVGGVVIPPSVVGIESYASSGGIAPKVSRDEAIQVPAVKRCRDLIAGSLGQLALVTTKPDLSVDATSWLQMPERNVPRSVTMTRLVEDLFFERVAWWQKVETGSNQFPLFVKRLRPGRVTVDDHAGKVYVDGRHVPDDQLIRFDSPNDGMLSAGARAIRQCLLLDRAAQRYAEGAPPGDHFTPADGEDPYATPEELRTELLDPWAEARRTRSTAYVPANVAYHPATFNPEQLELADQRQHAVLEIARVAGVDAEDLGVSTTSRTYENGLTRRQWFLDMTLGAYRAAIEDRLSMGDCTPRGTTVRFDLDGFLRSDAKYRFETYKLGLDVGAYAEDEIRPMEGRPQIPAEPIRESA